MTANRKTRVTRRAGGSILKFAPNFNAYVLPPDVVCLYSEDRKFFLHGELYCALASAIGSKVVSAARLAADLGRTFPPDKINEAIKRLVDRRYVIAKPPKVASPADGLWASLGLRGEVATQNLQ